MQTLLAIIITTVLVILAIRIELALAGCFLRVVVGLFFLALIIGGISAIFGLFGL